MITYKNFIVGLELRETIHNSSALLGFTMLATDPKIAYVEGLISKLEDRLGRCLYGQLKLFLFDIAGNAKGLSERELQLLFPEDLLAVASHLKNSCMMDPNLKPIVEKKDKQLSEYETDNKTFIALRVNIQRIRQELGRGLCDGRLPLVERGNSL